MVFSLSFHKSIEIKTCSSKIWNTKIKNKIKLKGKEMENSSYATFDC